VKNVIEHREIFVNGAWGLSEGTEMIPVINPATEEVIARVVDGTAGDVDKAARAARAAFDDWSLSSIEERVNIVTRARTYLVERLDEITDMIVREVGHPRAWAERAHAKGAIEDLRVIIESLPRIIWEQTVQGEINLVREAAGVVGAITPWNGPLASICTKAGAAIAAGCTVVLKPSELAPLTSYLFVEAFRTAGLPAGVLNVVGGKGSNVGEAIVTHPDIEMISLTGSLRAGRRIMELAAPSVKRLVLELGGKSANIILADADLEAAVKDGVADAFRNSGQACGCLTRMIVPESKLKAAEEIAAATAQTYIAGDPFDPKTTIGPMANANQYAMVHRYIQAGLDDGMRLLTGGRERPDGVGQKGFFVRPTVFSGSNSCRAAREEIFGPVITIIPAESDDAAIAIANDSQYGLAGGVWAATPEEARKVARRLRSGRVRINGRPMSNWAPHGGFKLSGFGREWGQVGIEEFTSYKSVIG
jgi:aldehyde dehydrogenase (NAD+)